MPDNDDTTTSALPRSYLPQSLSKALGVLECFDRAHPELTAQQIGRRLQVGTSTLYRYLAMLESAGLVDRVPDSQRWSLGLRMIELGGVALSRLEVRRHGQVLLESLADALTMNANLAVLYRGDVLHIAYAVRTEVDQLYTQVGRRTAAHLTSLGKALLAYMPWEQVRADVESGGWRPQTRNSITDFGRLEAELALIRERGYSIDRGEGHLDTYCVGAPVYGQSGKVQAALSVSAPFHRFAELEEAEIVRQVTRHAEMLSLRLGYTERMVIGG